MHSAIHATRARTDAALGALLLAVFLFKLIADVAAGHAANSLWMCHIANLMLAIGLIARAPAIMRAAVLWVLLGIPLWVLDMIYTGVVSIASVLAHLSGLAVSAYVLYVAGMGRSAALLAFALFLIVQQLCRFVSPPELNVNLALRVYDGALPWFQSYPLYWTVTTLGVAAALYGFERLLALRFPSPQSGGSHVRG